MEEDNDNTTVNNSKNGPWLLIAAVAVATLIAIWLVPGDKTGDSDEKNGLATTQTENPSLLAPKSATNDSLISKEVKLPAGAAARALIAELRQHNPLDLRRAFTAAQRHQKNGELSDAYLLYFFAAREGHGQAAFVLAQQADPAMNNENSIFEKADELQANKWYSKAQEAGVKGAKQALNTLRTSIENAAEQGDPRAQRIVLQWK